MEEIDTAFVANFETFLMSRIDYNTAKVYVRMMRTFFNQLRKRDYKELNLADAFIDFKYKLRKTKEKSLSVDEFRKLENFEIDKSSPIYKTKSYFLFQVYAGGLRISDLLTLQWNKINKDEINFYQYKTHGLHCVHIKESVADILIDLMIGFDEKIKAINDYVYFYDAKKDVIVRFNNANESLQYLFDKDLKESINDDGTINMEKLSRLTDETIQLFVEEENNLKQQKVKVKTEDDELPIDYFDINDETDNEIIEESQNIASEIEAQKISYSRYVDKLELINEYAKLHSKDFIFPLLKKDDFKAIDFDKQSYIIPEKQYRIIDVARTKYNADLKELHKLVFGDTLNNPLTSHTARYTTITLLIESGVDAYKGQKILGHHSVVITQGYINDSQHKQTIKDVSF